MVSVLRSSTPAVHPGITPSETLGCGGTDNSAAKTTIRIQQRQLIMLQRSGHITRRELIRRISAAGLAAPALSSVAFGSRPTDQLRHASFGAAGMAGSDIRSLTASPHLKLVAVAEVDLNRAEQLRQQFPDVRIYQDWRELLDNEQDLDSANISTPDHMHAPITMRAMQQGIHVYTQKPLTQTIFEARQLAKMAAETKLVTQMGIQIHSHPVHRTVVAIIQDGAIGKVREIHSWSGKQWGARSPKPDRVDPIPSSLDWDGWLGVAEDRPYLSGCYHTGQWRKRLDFGTGTFGDMGCHILDPVFTSVELGYPTSVRSEGGAPVDVSWGLDSKVRFEFGQTPYSTESVSLTWYDGNLRPPQSVASLIGDRPLSNQGSLYIGEDGVLYSPYIAAPVLLPAEQYSDYTAPDPGGNNHYLQFVDACRGEDQTSAPFSYAGPLTESVLLGCLATRFPQTTLEWDSENLRVTNVAEANPFVRRQYRDGWKVEGL